MAVTVNVGDIFTLFYLCQYIFAVISKMSYDVYLAVHFLSLFHSNIRKLNVLFFFS